jgi:hypothetical protein
MVATELRLEPLDDDTDVLRSSLLLAGTNGVEEAVPGGSHSTINGLRWRFSMLGSAESSFTSPEDALESRTIRAVTDTEFFLSRN